jgi:two-component system sensor histidine kinase KdpD
MAHTNAPGSRHPKRWQDIEELLDAGIDVFTTVNIQHLESLNDAVRGITGVQVRETFPDRLIAEADEVVVVDLTPEALINRLRRGVVYDLEKVDQALVSFFTPERLAALRELALRQTADEVDDQIIAALGDASEVAWAGREVVVVCVTAREESIRLVRRGFRLAERLHAELHVLHVVESGHVATPGEQRALDFIGETTRNLAASVDQVTGDDIAAEIVDYAVACRATFLVLGQSVRSRFEEIVRGSIVTRVMRETAGMDVVIVSDREDGKGPARRR